MYFLGKVNLSFPGVERRPMKTGLVMEGGAMRGMFTAGILDVWMENGILFDGAVGVSAGAVFGINLKSGQIGRVIRYNKAYCRDKRFVGVGSLLRTGDLYNAQFGYEEIPQKLDPFDTEAYERNPMEFYVVATDVDTGKAVYRLCPTAKGEDLLWMRASASMPGVSNIVSCGGLRLSDGGTADSIPLRFLESKGYRRNVVILTQPKGYVKKKYSHRKAFGLILRDYPALLNAMDIRPRMYNTELQYVAKQERFGNCLVLRPPEALNIPSVCRDPEELERVYQIGRKVAAETLADVKQFLEETKAL